MAETNIRKGRNDLCACGSGRKFKRCCGSAEAPQADAQGSFFRVAGILTALMLVVGAVAVVRSFVVDDGTRRVWSAEHGHWHEEGPNAAAPGKVWNKEHGHFHNAPALGHERKPESGVLEDRAQAEAKAQAERAEAAVAK